jgi:hypothetical protein
VLRRVAIAGGYATADLSIRRHRGGLRQC